MQRSPAKSLTSPPGPGAVDVTPDQSSAKTGLEIEIDRERAARYGVNVEDVQMAVEIARRQGRQHDRRGGSLPSSATRATAGRESRWRPGERDGHGRRHAHGQVPFLHADVRVVSGPSMIKTDNGLLRSTSSSSRPRHPVVRRGGKRAIESTPTHPPGYFIEWSGQFEHQRARPRCASSSHGAHPSSCSSFTTFKRLRALIMLRRPGRSSRAASSPR